MFADVEFIESIEETSMKLDREMYLGRPETSEGGLVRLDGDVARGESVPVATQRAAAQEANVRVQQPPPRARAAPQPVVPPHPVAAPVLPPDQVELAQFYRAADARGEITWNENAGIGAPWATWKTRTQRGAAWELAHGQQGRPP